jgi:hypothetical protein
MRGTLGRSDRISPPAVGALQPQRSGRLVDATGDDLELVTVYVRAETVEALPRAGRAIAELTWGAGGTIHRIEFDTMNGACLSVGADRVLVSVRSLDTVELQASATIGPSQRPSSREAQLTVNGQPIPLGGSDVFTVPPFAASIEIVRPSEASTTFRVELRDAAGVVIADTVVALGARCPRLGLPNNTVSVRVVSLVTDAAPPESIVTPTVVWGLWL